MEGIRVWTPVRPALENRDVMPWTEMQNVSTVKRLFRSELAVPHTTNRLAQCSLYSAQ